MAIKIDFLADVAKFLRGTKDVASALEDVADSLDDLGEQSEDAADKAGDGMKAAGKEAKTFEGKVSDAMRAVARDSQQAGKKVGDSQKQGFKEAEGGLKDFKEESASTAKESAASFDGSAESITDVFQEVAANAFAGFGPAGAAAGLAVAVGLGIAISAAQSLAEQNTAAKQSAVDMLDSITEAGGNLADLDLAEKIRSWGREVIEDNWLTFWADESSTKFQEIAKAAKEYGIDVSDAVRAAAGSSEDSQRLLDATAEAYQRLTREIEAGSSVTQEGVIVTNESARAAQKKRDALDQLRGKAEENKKTTADAVDIYNIEQGALKGTAEAAKQAADAIKAKDDATRAAANMAMDAQSAEINWAETLRSSQADIKANGKGISNYTAIGQANNKTLIDMAKSANQYIEAQAKAGTGADVLAGQSANLRQAFIDQAIAAGYPEQAAKDLATTYGLVPENVTTTVAAVGTEEAKAAVNSIPEAKDTTVNVAASGLEQAQTGISGIEGTEVKAEVKEQGVSETQAQIDAIKGKDVPITLRLTNLGDIQAQLAQLTQPRTQYIDVVRREGQAVAP